MRSWLKVVLPAFCALLLVPHINGSPPSQLLVSAMENRPLVEVLIKKNGTLAQQERCLSYTYLKKS